MLSSLLPCSFKFLPHYRCILFKHRPRFEQRRGFRFLDSTNRGKINSCACKCVCAHVCVCRRPVFAEREWSALSDIAALTSVLSIGRNQSGFSWCFFFLGAWCWEDRTTRRVKSTPAKVYNSNESPVKSVDFGAEMLKNATPRAASIPGSGAVTAPVI